MDKQVIAEPKVFKVPMNSIEVHERYVRLRQLGKFDVKVPIAHVSGIRTNRFGMVEVETSGGNKYKLSMGKEARNSADALELIMYG